MALIQMEDQQQAIEALVVIIHYFILRCNMLNFIGWGQVPLSEKSKTEV